MSHSNRFTEFSEKYNLDQLPEVRLLQLANLVHTENCKVNITAARSVDQITAEHILDSLTLLPLVKNKRATWIDVGSGGGFPALPLAICLPEIQFTLIESIGKKCAAMESICKAMEIRNCTILNQRAEPVGQDLQYRESFDYASARAVGSFAVQAELTLPLLKLNGCLLLQKSLETKIDEDFLNQQLRTLGGCLKQIHHLKHGQSTTRNRVVYEIIKIEKCASKYPRSAGRPAKRPLWKE